MIVSAQMLDVPLDDKLYSDVYDFIDRMSARQTVDKLFKNTLPYSHGKIAKILVKLDKKAKQGKLELSSVEQSRLEELLRFFSEDIQALYPSEKLKAVNPHLFQTQGERHRFFVDFGLGERVLHREKKTAYATLFHPTVSGQIRDYLVFYSDLKAYFLSAVRFSDFPKTEGRTYHGTETASGALTAYYIKTKLPWFSIFFGHDNLHWGPGRHGALLMSEKPKPVDMLKLTAHYYPAKFQAVHALLGSNIDRKYLSGHRLEFSLWDKLHLGIAETVVYGHRFEPVYLNPVQIYTVTEMIFPKAVGENDNVLISGDLDFTLLKNLEFYSEVMIDDHPLFKLKHWRTKFGVLFGGYWVDPFWIPDTTLRIEYAFVNQYSYTHKEPINIYTHFDIPIGHQIGNDADDLWISLKYWFTEQIAGSISYEIERHGETDITEGSDYDKLEEESPEWEFLSGVTESTHSISLGATCNMIGKYSAHLEYTRSWIRNASNQEGINDTNDQVLVSGQYRF